MLPTLTSERPRAAALLGFGAAQPADYVSGAELGAPFGKSAEWIRARTGIERLRRVSLVEELAALGEAAATDALAAAGIAATDVDLVLLATCSARPENWSTTALRRLAPRAAWMQMNAACSGFCYALQAADGFVRTGAARHVLIIAAEHMSGMLDADDLGTSIIFGDGVGAAVVGLSPDSRSGIGPTVSGSDGERGPVIEWVPGGFLQMAGQEVFRWAVEKVPPLAREACRRAGVKLSDIEVFVPHQANLRIVDAVTRALDLRHAVVADDVTVSGNTSAASIPIAMTRLLESDRARGGQLALLVGFGAGLSYAAQVVTLPQSVPARRTSC